jgi:RNA polymerase sigma-70 factor (ECF subfamily)
METTATAELEHEGAERTLAIDDFDQVVKHYWPRIFRFLLGALQDPDLAESLTQDCLWKAYRSRSAFRGECSLNTWLMRIAINLVRDQKRSRRFQFWRRAENSSVDSARQQDWLPAHGLSPEDKASLNEQVRSVWAATKSLSARQRTVFLLRFVEDMDIADIAETTGLSQNAVNVHLFRAVRAIRKRVRTTS